MLQRTNWIAKECFDQPAKEKLLVRGPNACYSFRREVALFVMHQVMKGMAETPQLNPAEYHEYTVAVCN